MAATKEKEEPPFMSSNEFAEKVFSKYLKVVEGDRSKKVTLDILNLNISIASNQEETAKINLCNLYKKCFMDLYDEVSAEEIESLIDKFVADSLTGLKGQDNTFWRNRNTIFPILRRRYFVDEFNKLSCAVSPGSKLTFVPFRSLPGTGIVLAIIEGPYIRFIHRGMINEWRKEQTAQVVFKAYKEKDEQLNAIVDLDKKSLLLEEIALLQIAIENFMNLIKKKYEDGVNLWHRYPCNAYKVELEGEEYSNLSGSLLLLPDLISQSPSFSLSGDPILLAPEENTVFAGGAREPLALCFIGDLTLDFKDARFFISLDPLRLIKNESGLWKWEPYVPTMGMRECSVPNSKSQVEVIFKCLANASKNDMRRPCVPVFMNLPTPLTIESQQKVEFCFGKYKSDNPNPMHTILCWYCGCTEKKLRQCEGCVLAVYCDRKCQKAHWKMHKEFCQRRSAARSSKAGQIEK